MSVDTSIGVGVGIIVTEEQLNTWGKKKFGEDFYPEDELDTWLGKKFPLLGYTVGGSYYDSKPNTYVITVKRLSKSYGTYDVPGGVVGFATPRITGEELEQLDKAAVKLGLGDSYKVGSYMSVLWH